MLPVNSSRGRGVTMVSWNVRPSQQCRVRCSWAGHIFQSTFSSKARGVAIMIKKNVPFQHIKTINDDNGRFLIVIGQLYSMHVTLVNIYGPNFDDAGFFRKTFDKLPDLSNTDLIIAGDFNAILDWHLDRSSKKQSNPSNASVTLNNLISSTNVVDIWRLQHPTDREYSFFSKLHNSYSRIDLFLLDSKLLPNMLDTKYHNIVISDHAPVSVKLDFNQQKQQMTWRLRPYLMNDVDFCKYLSGKFNDFLATNDTSDTSDSNLWEAFKAVMRSHIISYEASLKKIEELKTG